MTTATTIAITTIATTIAATIADMSPTACMVFMMTCELMYHNATQQADQYAPWQYLEDCVFEPLAQAKTYADS
jgi:hypothetical protein